MVRNQGALKLNNPWSRIGWVSFAAIVLASSLLGFVVLSRYQANGEPLDLWNAVWASPPTPAPRGARSPRCTLRRTLLGRRPRSIRFAPAMRSVGPLWR